MLRSAASWLGETLAPATKQEHFFNAAKNGGYLYVARYIKKYPSCSSLHRGLLLATQFNQVKTVSILVNHGIINNDALIQAIEDNNVEIVALLLGAGANCNILTPIYSGVGNLLTLACRSRSIKNELIQLLIAAGADLSITDSDYTVSPLLLTVMSGRHDLVEMLLLNGADVDEVNGNNKTALDIAIEENKIACLVHLLNAGADTSQKSHQPYPPIISAAKKNHIDMIQVLFSAGAKIPCDHDNRLLEYDFTYERLTRDFLRAALTEQKKNEAAFISAVKQQDYDAILSWLSKKIDVNCHDKQGSTAIAHASYIACKTHTSKEMMTKESKKDQTKKSKKVKIKSIKKNKVAFEIMQLLINAGANVDQHDRMERTPLFHILHSLNDENDHVIKVVKCLVNSTKTINAIDPSDGATTLHKAASKGFYELTKILLGAKANIEARKQARYSTEAHGCTPLMIAVITNKYQIVELLLAHGAKPNAATREGITALMYAFKLGNPWIIQRLLDAGADPHMRTDDNISTLMIAATNNYLDNVKLLLDLDVSIETKDGLTNNILLYALNLAYSVKKQFGRCIGYYPLIRMLLDLDVIDKNAQDSKGNTALILAAKYGLTHIVQLLIDRGALINIRNHHGYTALNQVCKIVDVECTDIIDALVHADADLEIPNFKQHTPLLSAARRNNHRAIETLLSHGAELAAVNEKYENALDLAFAFDSKSAISTLIAAGFNYHHLISTDKKQLRSSAVLNGCYELANRILCGLISITFISQYMPALNGLDSATDITADMDPSTKNNILFVRATTALPHVLLYDDSPKMQDLHLIILNYLTGNNKITIVKNNINSTEKNATQTLLITADKIAYIKEYMRAIHLDELSHQSLTKFMKNYLNIYNFDMSLDDFLPPFTPPQPNILLVPAELIPALLSANTASVASAAETTATGAAASATTDTAVSAAITANDTTSATSPISTVSPVSAASPVSAMTATARLYSIFSASSRTTSATNIESENDKQTQRPS